MKLSNCVFHCFVFVLLLSTSAICDELVQGDKIETVPGVPICESSSLMLEFDKKIKNNANVQEYLSLLKSGCFISDAKLFGMFVQKRSGIFEFSLDNGKKFYTLQKGIKYRDIDLVMLERVFENRFDEDYIVEEKDTFEKKERPTQGRAQQPQVARTTKRYKSEDEMLKYHVDNLSELRRRQREFLQRESEIYDFEDIRSIQFAKRQKQQTTEPPSSREKFRMKISKDELLGLLVFGGEEKKVDGECKIVLMDGSVLSGMFQNGVLNGKGEILFSNGVRLVGDFIDGVLNGYGEYIGNNVIMKGHFKDGKLNGLGNVYIRQRKEVVSGEFENGRLNGIGKICRVGYKCLIGSFNDGAFESVVAN